MKHTLKLILLLLAISSCQKQVGLETELDKKSQTPAEENNAVYSGVLEVKFSEEMAEAIEKGLDAGLPATKAADFYSLTESYEITSMERIFPVEVYEERTRREGLHRWYRLRFGNVKESAVKVAREFSDFPGVEIANPVRVPVSMYDDPDVGKLWGLYAGNGAAAHVNVEKVWRDYTEGDPSVIVAVLDEAVDLDHKDLAANTIAAGYGGSFNFIASSSTLVYLDGSGHGTHVAGTIAGVSNNGIGVSGVAGGNSAAGVPGVKILSCQILGDDNVQDPNSDATAMKYAADHGALISQNSWGYLVDKNDDGVVDKDEMKTAEMDISGSAIAEAIDYFRKYAGCDNDGNQLADSKMKGGVVFFAAGNDNINRNPLGEYNGVISVAAVDKDGSKAAFSNYGSWVDLCAPGVGIYSTANNDAYMSLNGTSMACPHVSGVAALVLSYRGGPGFTAEMLEDCMLKSANHDIPGHSQIGGLVDAYGAMTYGLLDNPDPIEDFSVTASSNTLEFSWTVPRGGDGDMPAYGGLVCYSKNKASMENLDPKRLPSDVKSYLLATDDLKVGDVYTGIVTGLDFSSDYYVTVIAANYGAVYAESYQSAKTVSTGANNPPVIEVDHDLDDLFVSASKKLTLTFTVSEPDGHAMKVEYIKGSDAETWMDFKDSYKLIINGPDVPAGNYSATVKATDKYGLATVIPVNYTIMENQTPVVIEQIENVLLSGLHVTQTVDVKSYFNDPDDDVLSYTVQNKSTSVAHIVVNDGKINVTSLSLGFADVTIIATDPKGAAVSQSFKVAVQEKGATLMVYPNPVVDYLNVSTIDPAQAHIRIVSSTGKTICDKTSEVSVFEPDRIDMTACSPGVYDMTVEYDGAKYKRSIVKL